jgi:hypothetical protein
MARGVGRLFTILIGFGILLSLGAGSIVHAAEPIPCVAEALAADHDESSPMPTSDQGPDKAAHVHGGCHGHHLATAEDEADLAALTPRRELRTTRDQTASPGAISGPMLRPPIA